MMNRFRLFFVGVGALVAIVTLPGGCPITGDVPIDIPVDADLNTDVEVGVDDVMTNVFNIEAGEGATVTIGDISGWTEGTEPVENEPTDPNEPADGAGFENYDLYFQVEAEGAIPVQLYVWAPDGRMYREDGTGGCGLGFLAGTASEGWYEYRFSFGYNHDEETEAFDGVMRIYRNGTLLSEEPIGAVEGESWEGELEYTL